MQNQPNKTMDSDSDAPRPVRSFHHARYGLLILLSVVGYFAAVQLFVPAAPLKAAAQTDANQPSQITLELPQFGQPIPQGIDQGFAVPSLPAPQLQLPTNGNGGNGTGSGSNSIQIIPRNSGSRFDEPARQPAAPLELACPSSQYHGYESQFGLRVTAGVGQFSASGAHAEEAENCRANSTGVWSPSELCGRR